MMFHLSPEQEQIQSSLRGVVEAAASARREALESGGAWPTALWSELMELGVGGVMLPEDLGGSELDLVDAALTLEALGEGAAPGPYMAQILAGLALRASADAALAQRWLPQLASGAVAAAVALPEVWNEEWVGLERADGLFGGTGLLLGGPRVDLAIVALADGDLALVETGGPGVEIAPFASSDPTRPLLKLRFDGAPFRPLNLNASDIARLLDAAYVLLAADALGGAERCLEMAVGYAKERVQFGRPIGAFQAIKHQLAQVALEVEPARALVWYAAYAWDTKAADASRACALAKAHLADRFTAAARAAVEVHGGLGYTWEYDLHIWLRRALFDQAYLGSPSWHRARAAMLAGW